MDRNVVVDASGQLSQYGLIRSFLTLKTLWILVLWSFGLFCVFLSPAPITITPVMQAKYDKKLKMSNELEIKMHAALHQAQSLRAHTNAAKVWFWRFKPEHRDEIRKRQIIEREAWDVAKEKQKKYDEAFSSAKSELGVWTESGINESRSLFWKAYQRGKFFAQRQTVSDALYSLLFHQNSDTLGRFLSLLMIACVNFTTGMIAALFLFLLQLPALIGSFQPGWMSGGLFFFISALGGLSVIAAFLALLYLSMLVFTFSMASPMIQRLENQRRNEYYIHHHRPHEE